MSTFARSSWDFLLDLVFPRQCLGCGEYSTWLCQDCTTLLPLALRELQLPHSPQLDKLWFVADFHEPMVSKLVKTCKYQGVRDLGPILGRLINSEIQKSSLVGDFLTSVILPVPVHSRRMRERGFNQTIEIAKGLEIQLSGQLVYRVNNTLHQADLDLASRLKNIESAFVFHRVENIPKRVILLDDVVTTGATMNEIAKVLKNNGVEEVWGLAFAHSMD